MADGVGTVATMARHDDPARQLWAGVETLHSVTYFHPLAIEAVTATGVKGFWMAYFAARAAPLGPIGPAPVTSMFANFAPRRVERALPDAWDFASPGDVLVARSDGAAAALAACGVPEPEPVLLEGLEALVAGLDLTGRPLAAANAALPAAGPAALLARLWQVCTTLREHRGDGHVAALVAAGLEGCEANVLATAVHAQDRAILRDTRAWTELEWADATARLVARDLVDPAGTLGPAGATLHRQIEVTTDELAAASYRRTLAGPELVDLVELVAAAARPVAATGLLPFPNPIGLRHAEAVG